MENNKMKRQRTTASQGILANAPVRPLDCGTIGVEPVCNANPECLWDPTDKCIPKTLIELMKDIQDIIDKKNTGRMLAVTADERIRRMRNSITYDQYFLSSTRAWRDEAIRFIKNKAEEKEDPCELATWLRNISVLTTAEKHSGSGTIIMKGLYNATKEDINRNISSNIIFKISYPSLDMLDNSLDVEKAIYKAVIMNLVNNRHTPGLISYLGEITCDSAIPVLPVDLESKYRGSLGAIDTNEYNISESPDILVLEMSKGVKLAQWINNTRTLKELLGVIFIVIYTLTCFQMVLLRHNDLHFENIFVEDIGRDITLFFQIKPGEIVSVVTRYIPKIYDFDRGAILNPSVPDNFLLDASLCADVGTCNDPNILFDFFSFLLNLWLFVINQIDDNSIINTIKQFIYKCVTREWLISTYETYKDKHPHLLRPNNLPTEVKQIKNTKLQPSGQPVGEMVTPVVALHLLYTSNWGVNTPFMLLNTSVPISRELLFTLPIMYKVAYFSEFPSNRAITTAQDASFFKSLEGSDLQDNYKYFFNNWPKNIWASRIFYNSGTNIKALSLSLAEEVKKNLPDGVVIPDVFLEYACVNLCCYQFYRLTQDTRLTAYDPVGLIVIDHIWNMFGNRLPIEIPVPYMIPL